MLAAMDDRARQADLFNTIPGPEPERVWVAPHERRGPHGPVFVKGFWREKRRP